MAYMELDVHSNRYLDTSKYPSIQEIRRWGQARKPEMIRSSGGIPLFLLKAWERANPDRPFNKRHSHHGTWLGYGTCACRCSRCIEAGREMYESHRERMHEAQMEEFFSS